MRRFLADLTAALRDLVHPQPWLAPERDETTPEVIAAWIAAHKHPAECASGCQCDLREGGA